MTDYINQKKIKIDERKAIYTPWTIEALQRKPISLVNHFHTPKFWRQKYQVFSYCSDNSNREIYIWETLDQNGVWSNDQNFILHVFSREFCHRFKKDHQLLTQQVISLSKDIYDMDNLFLAKEASEEEVPQVVFQINPLKTPGQDSMHVTFAKSVGLVLVRIFFVWLMRFFSSGHIFKDLNKTYISSIPKNKKEKRNPERVSDVRPISSTMSCTSLYLTSRLQITCSPS